MVYSKLCILDEFTLNGKGIEYQLGTIVNDLPEQTVVKNLVNSIIQKIARNCLS